MMKRCFMHGGIAAMATIGIFAFASCSRNVIIESPESIACANMSLGDLKATRVVTTDTATTIWFRMEYPVGNTFRYGSDSYLRDEIGRCYLLRSAENIKLDDFIQMPDTNVFEFKMNFEPLAREVQMFDYIEGNVERAFMLLGIHDRKLEQNTPSFEQLAAAYPYTVPDDWFTTDTIIVRGRIEGYDAGKLGFTSLAGHPTNIFEKTALSTIVYDISADGTFEKHFLASYPIRDNLWSHTQKGGFKDVCIFARPGDTIDITVRPNKYGSYECIYNSGSSKQVERWLKTGIIDYHLVAPLEAFKGDFTEAKKIAEKLWNLLTLRIATIGRHNNYTPQEMQLALAEMQAYFSGALLTYALYRKDELQKASNGLIFIDNIADYVTDTAEYFSLQNQKCYEPLHRIDFDNPLLMSSYNYHTIQNRIQYAEPVMNVRLKLLSARKDGQQVLDTICAVWHELMGSDHNNLMTQICIFRNSLNQGTLGYCPMEFTLPYFTHPYVRQKAEIFIAKEKFKTEPASVLPANNSAADFIRSFNARYPGRFLMFDFWGIGCGPCRQAIQDSKEMRAEIAKRTDVKLIFVADEYVEGGSEPYKQYVSEWLADEETICISPTEYAHLKELFGFSAIPHYETITPDGRRVREDLQLRGRPLNIDDKRMNQLRESLK